MGSMGPRSAEISRISRDLQNQQDLQRSAESAGSAEISRDQQDQQDQQRSVEICRISGIGSSGKDQRIWIVRVGGDVEGEISGWRF